MCCDFLLTRARRKYNAIVGSGIPILKRYDIPGKHERLFVFMIITIHIHYVEHLIPPDSRVEIDAKIAAGYFTSGKQITEADLSKTVGRTWEEVDGALHDMI
jgi:hypothetical protein